MSWEKILRKAKGHADRQDLHGRQSGWRSNPDWQDIAQEIAKEIGYEGDVFLNVDDFGIDIEVSKIKGIFDPVGVPKHIGLVPNNAFLDPYGAIAGGAFVKQKAIRFFFTACST